MISENDLSMIRGEIKMDSSKSVTWKINYIKLIEGKEVFSPKFLLETRNTETKWQLYVKKEKNEDTSEVSFFMKNLNDFDFEIMIYFKLCKMDGTITLSDFRSHQFTNNNRSSDLKLFSSPVNFIFIPHNHVNIDCSISNLKLINYKGKNFNILQQFKKFENLFMDQEFSDFIILAGGKEFYVHKCILITFSAVFKAMLKHNMKEKIENKIEITDIRPEVLREFLKFIYTGKVCRIKEIDKELLFAADKYCVEGLRVLCEDSLIQSLSLTNAIEYLEVALDNNAPNLQKTAIEFIATNCIKLCIKPELKSLGKKYPDAVFEIMNAIMKYVKKS